MKRENLPIVEIFQLSEAIGNENKFADELALFDIDESFSVPDGEDIEPLHMRFNGGTFVLVTHGSVKVSIDYVKYDVKANTLLMITPDHIVQFLHCSSDVKGKMLVFSRTFLEMYTNKNGPSVFQYMYVRKNPCMILNEHEMETLEEFYGLIKKRLHVSAHNFHKETVQVALLSFLFEVGNILWTKQENVTPVLNRKEELFQEFLKLLLEHVKQEHRVTFYADKLFITPQYLSAILKELSGKATNKWIDDALVLEAKLLLKAPQATVQEVADMLCFSDQSTFGKFFKKQVGMSPIEYRKS